MMPLINLSHGSSEDSDLQQALIASAQNTAREQKRQHATALNQQIIASTRSWLRTHLARQQPTGSHTRQVRPVTRVDAPGTTNLDADVIANGDCLWACLLVHAGNLLRDKQDRALEEHAAADMRKLMHLMLHAMDRTGSLQDILAEANLLAAVIAERLLAFQRGLGFRV